MRSEDPAHCSPPKSRDQSAPESVASGCNGPSWPVAQRVEPASPAPQRPDSRFRYRAELLEVCGGPPVQPRVTAAPARSQSPPALRAWSRAVPCPAEAPGAPHTTSPNCSSSCTLWPSEVGHPRCHAACGGAAIRSAGTRDASRPRLCSGWRGRCDSPGRSGLRDFTRRPGRGLMHDVAPIRRRGLRATSDRAPARSPVPPLSLAHEPGLAGPRYVAALGCSA
jgi:hypothetical protein